MNRTVETGVNDKTGEPTFSPVPASGCTTATAASSTPWYSIRHLVSIPPTRLNLWQGFIVKPKPGSCQRF